MHEDFVPNILQRAYPVPVGDDAAKRARHQRDEFARFDAKRLFI